MLCGRTSAPGPQDQGQDIPMPNAAGDCTPHGGPHQDGHPDQGLQPNPEGPGPGIQEGQKPVEPTDYNAMVGAVPPKVIKRLECQQLLHRIGFFLDVAQAIIHNHGYNTAKKLSHLRPDDVDILCKTLCSPGRERKNGTQDPGINTPHLAQRAMTSVCFVLYHREQCDLCPMLNTITHENIYDLDLQRAQETKHNSNFYWKNRPKWDDKDPKKSLTNIRE